MHLRTLKGDRTGALRAFHACATTLRRELGVEPSPATRRAYEQLLSTEAPPKPTPRLDAGLIPLVGRGEEWAQLQVAWRRAARGPRFVLVLGEAGIGKTRLAEELLHWAAQQGIDHAYARSYAAEGELAYSPVAALLRSRPLPTLDEVWLSEVARLLPEVLTERPDLPRPQPMSESWHRQRLFEALARALLGDATPTNPLLLVLDDLQWCDRETLDWLHYLLRSVPQVRLLVVGTCRPEELDSDCPLSAALPALHRDLRLTEIELGPLGEAQTATLAASIAGQALDPAAIAHLYQETEGNPLFVVETLRVGLATPQERLESEGLRLPPRVQAVLETRLTRLSPPTRELAGLAAIIGRSFAVDVLEQASGGDEDALVLGLDELWQQRIVRERGADAYDFTHDKLRETAYNLLGPARRRLLHHRVAQALEVVHATEQDTVASQVAVHFDRAGLAERAIPYYAQAGEFAVARYANEEAMAHLSRALELSPETDCEIRYRLLVMREEVCDRLGRRDAHRRDLVELEALAEKLGTEQQAEVANRWAMYANQTGEFASAIEAAQMVVDRARACGQAELQVEGHLRWGVALNYQGDSAAAQIHCEEALALAQTAGLPRLEAAALLRLGSICEQRCDWIRLQEFSDQALRLSHQTGDRWEEQAALTNLGYAACCLGDYAEAWARFEQVLHLALETGASVHEQYALLNFGLISYCVGNYRHAREYVDRLLLLAREIGDRRAQLYGLWILCDLAHCLQEYAAARDYGTEGLQLARELEYVEAEASALDGLGWLHLDLGDHAAAQGCLERALHLFRKLGAPAHAMVTLAGLASTTRKLGKPGQAEAQVDEILDYLDAGGTLSGDGRPFWVYLTCYQVLDAAADPRAPSVLAEAYAMLQEWAARMPDEEMQRSFLENVPWHREIVELAREANLPA
jgi:predicted ATPase